jgi:hypothetical protein
MKHIGPVDLQFETQPLYDELRLHPEIWNEIPFRTDFPGSPHREVDDIWVRYNSLENYHGDGVEFNSEHESVWYPVIQKIPTARLLAIELARLLDAERLGGVLITRIPARRQVYPHIDKGWHAGYYSKYIIQVASARGQSFCFADGEFPSETGDCYWFDNSVSHWVLNNSDVERISLIVCIRRPTCH